MGLPLAALGLAAIAILTLEPNPGQAAASAATPLLCLVCGNKGGVDVVLNLLLFAPFGAGLRLAGWRWRSVVAAAALVSFTVEFLQYTVVTGRDASLSDLVTNTTGAAVAAALAARWRAFVLPSPRVAAVLFAGWSLLWIAILSATVWLQGPRSLRGPIRSGWPDMASSDRGYRGRVLEARVDGMIMPRQETPPDRAALRRSLDRGAATIEVRAISGPPTPDLVFLYYLQVHHTPLLALGQYGRDAVLVVPSRAQRLRIWSPTLQLRDAFPPDSGVPVRLRGAIRDGRLTMSVAWSGNVRQDGMDLRPTQGWLAVPPMKFVLGRSVRLLTALWIGALVLPLGWWAAFLPRRGTALSLLAAVVAAGLLVLPALTGSPPSHWTEWTAAVAAAVLGWAGSRFAAYLQGRCASPSINGSSSS
ncbi:MAG TPA: VanZ family protein [Gemmatimonadales bacterium]|nr:VanZ family protein [Gemmatimonadales bacterium]